MNYTYPQQYRPIQQQSWAPQIPQVRPVSSIEEVRAYPIEFDGSIFYFPDIANKKIYTKFVNLDGTVAIGLYEFKDFNNANQSIDVSSYITRDEFDSVVSQLKQMFQEIKEEEEHLKIAAQPQKTTEFNF